ncbi:MAG TPA: protein kinase [Pyrinomonadaceae bacterium]|nr:protein kinase [Pyrinomonadaceae bacterium]
MLEPGTSLGPYEIKSPLGKGGMGEVYLAHDSRLNRSVALKVLPRDLASDPQRMRRFSQEAKTTSALNHPNLLTIYEIGQEDSILFIATEYVDGETLRTNLSAGPLPYGEVLRIGSQVAEALAAAHEAGIVHRDIKPENIMLRRRDHIVKVLDFGLAKHTDQSAQRRLTDSGASSSTMIQTEANVIVGTGKYMSPEQARGLPVDTRTDVWSLGVVIYEMLAGYPPFTGETGSDLIVAILDREPARLPEREPPIPLELQRIIRKALSKDREKRYQTIKDLAVDLESLRLELQLSAEHQRIMSSASIERPFTGQSVQTSRSVPINTAEQPTEAIPRFLAKSNRLKWVIAGAAALVLAVAVATYFYFHRATNPAIDSIAVLPFVNVGLDPNMDYISDGITDSIIDGISQLPNLAVIARSSVFRYKGREIDPQAVAKELGVHAVLTGVITQRGDNLSISAELVDASNNHRIWGERYERQLSDILLVQSDIAKDISESLRSKLTGEEKRRVVKRFTDNPAAYQAYLKGRYHWNKRTAADLNKSIEYYNQAIAIDPEYALAYSGLADCYLVLPDYSDVPAQEAHPKSKAAALKALELDETLAEAHAALGGVKIDSEWDFVGAETELKRAIELNPNYATAHHWYAQYLSVMGRHEEAVKEIRRAQELDPLSLIINAVLGDTYTKARRYDEAILQLRKTIEMDQNFSRAYRYLGNAYVEKGMFADAIAAYQTAATLGGEPAEQAAKRATELKAAVAAAGAKGYWEKQLENAKDVKVSPYGMASIYARLNDKEEALNWLDKAYRERDPYVVYMKIDPQFDSLRSDQRSQDLMRQIGLLK